MPESRDTPRAPAPDSKSGAAMRASLERALADAAGTGAGFQPPPVPDHTLLQRIGSGAYGEVWLARNALGTLRAVKIVFRARFKEDKPYEREFHGILKYEPLSRTHEGMVQVLHVGRGEGCFYCVMEVADDASGGSGGAGERGSEENPLLSHTLTLPSYTPRTLHSELARRPRLPPVEAAQLVLRLANALAHLHRHGLVHRDIKPSNVIFVDGKPKLADIGLVTDVGSSQSFVGTEGFIPPEGPGTPQADLYGLGKLLYELATGRDRMDFPQLPPLATSGGAARAARRVANETTGDELCSQRERTHHDDAKALLELNEVMTRACAPEPKQRYASATELQAELNLFLAGRSLRHTRIVERTLARLKRFAVAACVFLALASGAIWHFKNEERHANERARQATDHARMEAESRVKESTLRQRAESAEHATQQQLHTALLEQARATVLSGEMGQRARALEALRRAGAISNTAELRREVFAALALPDLRFERELPHSEEFTRILDPSFERIALGLRRRRGPVEIRSTSDQRLLATLPASTNLPVYVMEWSADGRFLAVKRDHPPSGIRADWEVWETANWRRILLLRDLPLGAVAFHPRLPRVCLGQRAGAAIWDLESGAEVSRFPLAGTPFWLRFAPDGERFAGLYELRGGWIASVHEVANPSAAPLASHAFAALLSTCNWHPGGRWMALADLSGNIHGMDAQTGETRVIGRHKAQAVRVEFSPDGNYLISGAWGHEMICWDAQTLQRAFSLRLESYDGQFRADGRAYAGATRSGVQLHAFERPSGFRAFAEDLGVRLDQAAFSPDGRWLAASAGERMGVWDLTATAPGALEEKAFGASCFFTSDGSELFAIRAREGTPAGFRWRIMPATNGGPPRLERLPLPRPAGFAALSLHGDSVVMTGTNGTRLFPRDEAGAGPRPDGWMPTVAGLNGVSPDGRWLGVFRRASATLHVHRLPGLEPVARLTQLPHLGNISSFDFSPAGDEVALSSSRGVEFWSTTTWQRTRALTNFTHPFLYAPDGRSLWVTIKERQGAGLYDARTLEPRLLLPAGMLPLAASPDGRHLAVSVDAQRLQLWDLAALREQFRELGLDWEER